MNPDIIYVWIDKDGDWKASWHKPEGENCLQIEVEQGHERPLLWDDNGNEVEVM